MGNYHNGKKKIMIIIGLMILLSLSTIVLVTKKAGISSLKPQIINLILTVVLCYFLYKGKKWARIVILTLSVLGLVGVILTFIFVFVPITDSILKLFAIMDFVIYIYCAVMLAISKDIKEYIIKSNL